QDRRLTHLRAYAALEILVAVTALLLPVALNASTPMLAWAYADGAAPARFAIVRVVISLALLGIPAAAMGATFPIAAAWLASRDKGQASFSGTGSLYASNTAGAALGALAAGFWLVPTLGLRGTTWVGVGLNCAAAAGALWLPRKARTAELAEIAERTPVTKKKTQSQRTQRVP